MFFLSCFVGPFLLILSRTLQSDTINDVLLTINLRDLLSATAIDRGPSCIKSSSKSASGTVCAVEEPPTNFDFSDCKWQKTSDVDMFWSWESVDQDSVSDDHLNIEISVCRERAWTAFSFGPFNTTGGISWTGIGALVDASAFSCVDPVLAADAFMLGNVDQMGIPAHSSTPFSFLGFFPTK